MFRPKARIQVSIPEHTRRRPIRRGLNFAAVDDIIRAPTAAHIKVVSLAVGVRPGEGLRRRIDAPGTVGWIDQRRRTPEYRENAGLVADRVVRRRKSARPHFIRTYRTGRAGGSLEGRRARQQSQRIAVHETINGEQKRRERIEVQLGGRQHADRQQCRRNIHDHGCSGLRVLLVVVRHERDRQVVHAGMHDRSRRRGVEKLARHRSGGLQLRRPERRSVREWVGCAPGDLRVLYAGRESEICRTRIREQKAGRVSKFCDDRSGIRAGRDACSGKVDDDLRIGVVSGGDTCRLPEELELNGNAADWTCRHFNARRQAGGLACARNRTGCGQPAARCQVAVHGGAGAARFHEETDNLDDADLVQPRLERRYVLCRVEDGQLYDPRTPCERASDDGFRTRVPRGGGILSHKVVDAHRGRPAQDTGFNRNQIADVIRYADAAGNEVPEIDGTSVAEAHRNGAVRIRCRGRVLKSYHQQSSIIGRRLVPALRVVDVGISTGCVEGGCRSLILDPRIRNGDWAEAVSRELRFSGNGQRQTAQNGDNCRRKSSTHTR